MRPTVYIPNLNGGATLGRALASLAAQTCTTDVMLVDNGSSDGSVAQARATFPDLVILELGANRGFGASLNAAVNHAPGDPLIFLNNDVECEPQFIAALLDELGPGGEMIAGVLLQHGRSQLIDSAGVVVDRSLMAFDYLHGHRADEAGRSVPPLGPTGAAALIRLDAFNDVRGFDERMFAYYEDADLAVRLRRRGARCRLAADARASHRYSSTVGRGTARKYALTGFSRGYMLRRYGVLRDPKLALHVLACEGAICAGQLLFDRTARGVKGRFLGWRAAAGLPREEMPSDGAIELSVRRALALRAGRRWR